MLQSHVQAAVWSRSFLTLHAVMCASWQVAENDLQNLRDPWPEQQRLRQRASLPSAAQVAHMMMLAVPAACNTSVKWHSSSAVCRQADRTMHTLCA